MFSLSPLNVTQCNTTLSAALSLSCEDELISLEHSTHVEPCFVDESPTAAVQYEVVETATTGTVEPCHVYDSHATRDDKSDTTHTREPHQSSPVIGSAVTPPDHEGNLTYTVH